MKNILLANIIDDAAQNPEIINYIIIAMIIVIIVLIISMLRKNKK